MRFGPSLAGLRHNLVDLIDHRITDAAAAYSALSKNVSGWGLVALACGLPGLVTALREEPAMRRLAIACTCALLEVVRDGIRRGLFVRVTGQFLSRR